MTEKRLTYFLPNFFTALNMGCGFAAILMAQKGLFLNACLIVWLGAVFDSVDGRIARLTGTQSIFGEQFDSMSDLISFGMAPAIIYYEMFLKFHGRIGMLLAFVFLLCGALRLARFNANIEKVDPDYFQGLPIPAAALTTIGFVLMSLKWPVLKGEIVISCALFFLISVSMISNIPFVSFKNSDWIKTHKRMTLVILMIIIGSALIKNYLVGIYMGLYVFGSMIYYIKNRKRFKGMFSFEDGNET